MSAVQNAPRTLILAERRKAERRYQRLVDRVLRMAESQIKAIPNPTPADITRVMLHIASTPQFDDMCVATAQQIVTMLAVGQKASWRAAAQASSKGAQIYRALMRETTNTVLGQQISSIVAQNATLIKTVPQRMAQQFSELARKREFEGVRPEEIAQEMLGKAPHLREFEAKRIARTESAKASTALVQARSESLGLDFYTWHTAGDERVRDAHRKLNGVICRWSDPPNPEAIAGTGRSYGSYHPGGIFNCRCVALSVIAIEDIHFPAKVHISGSIVTIGSLKSFKERFGLGNGKDEE